MASETQAPPLPGAVKKIRAITDMVYLGRLIRGRRFERTDQGKLGAYDVKRIEGEEFECDQSFAKGVVMSGKAEPVSGGLVDVVEQPDGYPIYQRWVRNPSDPVPVYERCELLKPLWFGDGCLLPVGTKCRLDVSQCDRSKLCYEDTELQPGWHAYRVLKPSPKKVRMSQAEQQGKINALYSKFFPEPA